ncbi:MAG: amino acid ABC transporter permease [Mesorhizobium sp.]|nr:MAG: amino acid ABC transporter permease [Mesorhizobium sp.]
MIWDWAFAFEILPVLARAAIVSIEATLIGFALAASLGLVLAVVRIAVPWTGWTISVLVELIRSTPLLIQIFFLYFVFPKFGVVLDAFTAGIIALTNLAACFICEIVVAGIRSVPTGQVEAALASGLSRWQRMRQVVLPQAMRIVLPPLVGQYVLLIKDSSVVSAIGLTDLTRVGWLVVQRVPNGLLVFFLVGLGYFIVCYPLIMLARRLEQRMGAAHGEVQL